MHQKTLLCVFIVLAQSQELFGTEIVWPDEPYFKTFKRSDKTKFESLDKKCYQRALSQDNPEDETNIVVVDISIHRTEFYDQQNDTLPTKYFSVRLSKGQRKTESFLTPVSTIFS